MEKIRVLLADDHPVFRSGLQSIIHADKKYEIIGEANTGEEALNIAQKEIPDIIIMDVNMPGIDGIEATRKIKDLHPSMKVLILTMYSDEAFLREGLNAGAEGYVLKKAVDTELMSAIRTVMGGQKYIYPTLIPSLYDSIEARASHDVSEEILSQREKEVLKYIALGFTHQEIAENLFISSKTVDTYKARIMDKLNVTKRSELVRFALKHHYIS